MKTDGWSFADVWDVVAADLPEAPAIVHRAGTTTWAQFRERSKRLGDGLIAMGLSRQAKVAEYLFNCPEYLECFAGCLRASLVPVNTNYRYVTDEVAQLWLDTDVEAVVFDADLAAHVDAARSRLPEVKAWVCVTRSTSQTVPPWAVGYDDLIAGASSARPRWRRSGDDEILLCTGGTTGTPKGVIWRQDDLYNAVSERTFRDPPTSDLAAVRRRLTTRGARMLPASPLAHSLGLTMSLAILSQGGTIVLPEAHGFAPAVIVNDVVGHGVHQLVIVGDAFAGPLNDELDQRPRDLSRLRFVFSGGAAWSRTQKERLLQHLPQVTLVDLYGSSEVFGAATSKSTVTDRAAFRPHRRSVVLGQDDTVLGPGDGPGLLAVGGYHPVGYYKDPQRTRALFREVDGVRYAVSGDYAQVEPDGTMTLLGRGSAVINTGGEKVFPGEVEDRIRGFSMVGDAVVVGLPDPRFGERVGALVQTDTPHRLVVDELDAFLRMRLAPYKVPRTYAVVVALPRNTNGKVDYAAAIDELTKDGADR